MRQIYILKVVFQIVWDEAKKQWVNKDGSDEGNTVAAPPPKDHEIPGRAGPKPGPLTEKRGSLPVAPSAPSADGAGNMFQRRRGPLGMFVGTEVAQE